LYCHVWFGLSSRILFWAVLSCLVGEFDCSVAMKGSTGWGRGLLFVVGSFNLFAHVASVGEIPSMVPAVEVGLKWIDIMGWRYGERSEI
jgi:hypothetical protein